MARALGVRCTALLLFLASPGWIACNPATATSLAQTSDGVTRSLPRTGDVLQLAPDNVEGEAVVDVPSASGGPAFALSPGR